MEDKKMDDNQNRRRPKWKITKICCRVYKTLPIVTAQPNIAYCDSPT